MKWLFFLKSFLVPVKIDNRKGEVTSRLEVNLRFGKYILDATRVNYSFGSLHKIFTQTLTHYKIQNRGIKNVLILGFGVGSVARILQNGYNLNCAITGVEKDKVVIELGKQYFGTADYKKFNLVYDDAYDYVQNNHNKFDMIIIDLFIEDEVPAKFHDPIFFHYVKVLLSRGGVLFFNKVTNNDKLKAEAENLVKTMSKILGKIEILRITINGSENSVLVYQDDKKSTFFNSKIKIKKKNWVEEKNRLFIN